MGPVVALEARRGRIADVGWPAGSARFAKGREMAASHVVDAAEVVLPLNSLVIAIERLDAESDHQAAKRLEYQAKKLAMCVLQRLGGSSDDIVAQSGDYATTSYLRAIWRDIPWRRGNTPALTKDRIVRLRSWLEKLEYLLTAAPQGTKPPEAPGQKDGVVYLGGGRLRMGTEVVVFEGQESFVLEALVELQAATKMQLEVKSGVSDAVRILKGIVRKHPALSAYVTMAKRRGTGGYRTSIQRKGG